MISAGWRHTPYPAYVVRLCKPDKRSAIRHNYVLRVGQFLAPVKSLLAFFSRLAQNFVDLRRIDRTGNAITQNGDLAP
ncbi:hypothetical protein AH448_07065 [Salmonella enterica subsp. diarizonae]|uniref:Uncharacterized protein n=6 Tax=Salmonella enterica TaxID=28901 RepID=A0A3L7MJY3_SALDZ|nr:hypothetical protein DOE63_19070 [Salmonella enterica subsp. diarizonae serovar 59:z10:-]AXC70555.1 hypothetical protein DOE59_02330 [Salmonella enterica subsp. diarizonae serovar 48:i:z]AXD07933.1 hypothetical protein CHE29_02420 [Salmonella enterica]EAA0679952.1 hypothetical protein [Salmonella enterica subsp. diarizonae]EAA7932309.1 hypothetical protein [Salmonella enterica subsp. enterica serovar Redlands]EAS9237639.1 hypothetical protein [Salmonella enterica subsp. enterica]EBE3719413